MENTKMMRSAKVIDRVLRVLEGVLMASGVVAAAKVLLVYAVGEGFVQDLSFIELGNLSLRLHDAAVPSFEAIRPSIVLELIAIIIKIATGWHLLHVIREVFRPMTEGRPFEKGASGKIRQLVWIELICGAVIELSKLFSRVIEMKCYDMSLLLNSDAIHSFDYIYDFNFEFVLVALVLYFLARVFRHGETLQKETDEAP